MKRPPCDVCGLPATNAGGICGAELCDDPECFGVAWDRAFVAEKARG